MTQIILQGFEDNVAETTHRRQFRIERRDLVYLKFILEAYEGMATLSTVDREHGVIEITFTDFFAAPVDDLLSVLSSEISLREIGSASFSANLATELCGGL